MLDRRQIVYWTVGKRITVPGNSHPINRLFRAICLFRAKLSEW